ncbi:MAG: DUF3316 domain-containing protein [Candidatus Symbiothrix sp.]|jgi:hypothetical protein|nr:DUF3316 domain-containing protein [Candidatus Symbiothrix sp.]
MKLVLIILTGILALSSGRAQEILTYRLKSIGVGTTSIYDSYLSPLQYDGLQLSFIDEQLRATNLLKGRVVSQSMLNFSLASTLNPAQNAATYAGYFSGVFGELYRLPLSTQNNMPTVFAGVTGEALVGILYNTRNGNNPVNVKLHLNLNLSLLAAYRFQIAKQALQVRYQLSAPAVGVCFSPEYGQAYYEMALEESNENLFHFASWHNHQRWNNYLSLELPLNRFALFIAYRNNYYALKINGLQTRITANSFFAGVSMYLHTVSSRTYKPQYRYVF